jgi:hypothetical protein
VLAVGTLALIYALLGYQDAMARRKASRSKRSAGAVTRVRDTITGRFLKRGTEKRRPKTTVVERITGRRRGKKR